MKINKLFSKIYDEKKTDEDLILELEKVYDSEINYSIEVFWDGGFFVRIGDDMNGYVDEEIFKSLREGIKWLLKRVKELYPNSKYAKESLCENKKIQEVKRDAEKE